MNVFFSNGNVEAAGCILTVFGGTGDLTFRKLIPAAYSLIAGKKFNDNFLVVLIGRRNLTEEEFCRQIEESVRKYSRKQFDDAGLGIFLKRVFYKRFDFLSEKKGYQELDLYLEELSAKFDTGGNRLYYLAVSPDYFGPILENLHFYSMLDNKDSFRRVLIEKPFGFSLDSARALNSSIKELIDEENILRIDHYLGKEMIQNIIAVRFGNAIFESLWSNKYIDHVQITVSEQLGVENRGGYFDKTGVLKDIVQNHILQMLALIAMEPPSSMCAEELRREKINALRSISLYGKSDAKYVCRGQYGAGFINGVTVPGYRDEEKVDPESETETFVSLRIAIDNDRWRGVPFYVRTGKRLDVRKTEIVVQFKSSSEELGFELLKDAEPNLLVFAVQPFEGFYFKINTKTPGGEFRLEPVHMDYCQSCRVDVNSPEAYESLLQEAVKGNVSFFISWEELESSWEFIESVEQALKGIAVDFPNYNAGTAGPPEAQQLLLSEGRRWWDMDYSSCIKRSGR